MKLSADDKRLIEQMSSLDGLLQELETSADPAMQARVNGAIRTLLEFHGHALHKILDRIADTPQCGEAILAALASEPLVSNLLILHDLHPQDLETRVRGALDSVQPYLASHGGHVVLEGISPDGMVKLRLQGSCHGCPSSRVTLQDTIEESILAAAPDVVGIQVEGLLEETAPPAQNGFVSVADLEVNGAPLGAVP